MKLFIIRHGDPDYSHDSLTERGQKEAELLRDRLLGENITKVYSSPLGRAKATVQPFLDATGLDCTVYDWLREFPICIDQPTKMLGLADSDRHSCPWDLDARVFTAYSEQLSDLKRWGEHPMYSSSGVTECCNKIFAGLDGLLADNGIVREGYVYRRSDAVTDEECENANVAIYCHMGLGSLLISHLAYIAPPLFWQMFRFMPTSVTTVLFPEVTAGYVQAKIFAVGDTTHVAPIGLTYRG